MEIRCDRAVTSGMDEEKIADYMEMLLKVFQSGERGKRKNANYTFLQWFFSVLQQAVSCGDGGT